MVGAAEETQLKRLEMQVENGGGGAWDYLCLLHKLKVRQSHNVLKYGLPIVNDPNLRSKLGNDGHFSIFFFLLLFLFFIFWVSRFHLVFDNLSENFEWMRNAFFLMTELDSNRQTHDLQLDNFDSNVMIALEGGWLMGSVVFGCVIMIWTLFSGLFVLDRGCLDSRKLGLQLRIVFRSNNLQFDNIWIHGAWWNAFLVLYE